MYQPSTSNRLLYTLFIAQSLFSAGQIAIFTLIAIVATQLSGTESAAGLPSSTQTFTQAFAAFPIAVVMGRFGRRVGLTMGYALGAVGAVVGIIAILQGVFPLLLLSAAFLGMSRASADQSRFAAGELFPKDMRARMIGRVIFAGTIGAVAGPALVDPAGRVAASLGLPADSGPWLIAFGLYGLASLLILLVLRPDPMRIGRAIADEEEQVEAVDSPRQPVRPLRTLLMLPTVQLAILSILVSQTVMVVLMVLTPLHMEHHNHTRGAISMVISAHTLGMFGLSAVTGYLIDRIGRIPMLVAAGVTLILAALLAPVAQGEFMLAVALFLLGLGWNFGYVAGSSLLADALQGAERARVQGVNDSLVAFAAGIGSLSSGPLFAAGGYGAVSAIGIVLTLVLMVMVYWLTRPRLEARAI